MEAGTLRRAFLHYQKTVPTITSFGRLTTSPFAYKKRSTVSTPKTYLPTSIPLLNIIAHSSLHPAAAIAHCHSNPSPRYHPDDDMATKKEAPPKKRASSPAKGTRSSKRLKAQTPKARPTISTIPTQDGCAFLNLPREIRNQVYMELLEGLDLTFRVDRLIVVARRNPEGYFRRSKLTERGLPLWALSSQQICYEFLDLIARTYTFQPCGRPKLVESEVYEGVPNTLIFTSGGVRNVRMFPMFPRTAVSTGTAGDQSVAFLKLMDNVSLKDADLGMVWQYDYQHARQVWKQNEPAKLTNEWGKDWEGKFRKVKISVAVVSGPEKDTTPLFVMDEAEKCALRLVGKGGTLSWEDRTDMVRGFWGWRSYQTTAWVRHVTVERKV